MTRTPSAAAPAFLALSCVGFIASAPAIAADRDPKAPALAAPAADGDQTQQQQQAREDIIVTGDVYQPHQESPKAVRSVRDTPQTVTVITNETIEQQNLLTLRDVLSTVPGITFGAAEGGTPPSDQITLRGYSASSDITQDGVRDSGAYSRSDPFNIEQIEIVNGANSVTNGSGSVGGSINLVTKRPLSEDRIIASAGIGTDDYYRGAIDANIRANDLVAFRLNGMVHRNDVPGRDIEKYKRWGIAPSVTLGIASPTRLTIQYLHQEDDNIPQYGVPYARNAFNDGPLPGVDRGNYYGYRNIDTQEITVDQATIIAEHDFSDRVSIRNLARWQSVEQLTVVGPPQGTYCLDGGVQPNGTACPANVPVGYYSISGPRGNYRDSKNELMYDQIDLRAGFATGPIEHTLTLGGSASWEKYTLATGNVLRNADGTAVYPAGGFPLVNIANPYDLVQGPAGFTYGSNVYDGPVNFIPSGGQHGEVTNYALYLFDAMKLGKVELNGGIRWESNSGSYITDTSTPAATPTVPQGPVVRGPRLDNDAKLFSYRVGLVYKPVEAVSLYAAYGNSRTPSISAVNGACVETSCNVDPESAKNYEIGAKAELSGGRLLLTAALFRNERDKYKVPSNDPAVPDQVLDGHSRVDGVALGAVGKITPAWSITANYTYLKSKLIRSVAVGVDDPAAGAELQNTPKHSGSLFTTYELPFGLRIGYGVTYQGSFAPLLPTAAAPIVYRSDDYWVHNAYLAYDLTEHLSAQVNVKNFTDELYFTRIRNSGSVGWATPGDGRAAIFTLNYRY